MAEGVGFEPTLGIGIAKSIRVVEQKCYRDITHHVRQGEGERMNKLIIRDGFATINGDKTVCEMPSGSLEIVAQDGRTLFSISIDSEGAIIIWGGSVCKHHERILDDKLILFPVSSNKVCIARPEHSPG